MKPAIWRAIMLPVILVAALFVLFGPMVQIERDDLGMAYAPSFSNPEIVPQSITPGSPAARAGIHKGDHITLASYDLMTRTSFEFPVPGARIPIIVNGTRHVTLVAGPATATNYSATLEFNIVRLAFLLVAALLVWRRPDDRVSRTLVAFLFALGFGIALNNHAFGSPLLSLIFLQVLSASLVLYAMGAGARFAAIFPTGTAPQGARNLAGAATIISTLGIATILIVSLADVNSRVNAGYATLAVLGAFLVSMMLVGATLLERYIHAPKSERKRRLWIFLILGVGLVGPAIDIAVLVITGSQNHLIDQFGSLSFIIIPIGLAYVILRHRVIDLGFVLNRAAVYAVVSIFIVGIFVIVETLLAKYVETTSHVTSIAVQLAVALGLGFSIRAIHARADRFVDTILFRERHAAEAALREFAHDAPYITDADVLGARTVEITARNTHATFAGIWLREENGDYVLFKGTSGEGVTVTENDPAVLVMRARRVVVELVDTGSKLPGQIAFPMIVRGELLGMLVCGSKVGEEVYAPDERDALEALATAVGHAVDALEVRELRLRLERLELAI